MRKKKFKVILMMILFIVFIISTSVSYGYFNNKFKGIHGANGLLQGINIENGKEAIVVDKSAAKWYGVDGDTISNPQEGQELEYKGLKIINDSNLVSNVQVKMKFNGKKEGGTVEDNSGGESGGGISEEPSGPDAAGFDVLVGDEDNFGYGYGTTNIYAGEITSGHPLTVFPDVNDPDGTDRKMVTTGFYNYYKSIPIISENKDYTGGLSLVAYTKGADGLTWKWSNSTDASKKANDNCQWDANFYSIYFKQDGTWGKMSSFENDSAKLGCFTAVNDEIFFDGYTQRSIRGWTSSSSWTNNSDKIDSKNVNWRYLHPVEPVTIKYDGKIGEEERINRAVVKIMLDDIQPMQDDTTIRNSLSLAVDNDSWSSMYGCSKSEWYLGFSAKSRAVYKATIRVPGDDKFGEFVEVKEWSDTINKLSQTGARSNMITLEIPQRFYKYIRKGSTSGNGIQIKIDDDRQGIASGDSYAIDFVKLIVNKAAEYHCTVKGTVYDNDTKKVIPYASIMVNGIEKTKADGNGEFQLNDVEPGQVVIAAEHLAYNKGNKLIYNISSNSEVNVTLYLSKREIPITMEPQLKFTGEVTVRKYDKAKGNVKVGEDIIVPIKVVESGDGGEINIEDLKIDPGFYYTVDYKIILKSKGLIDPFKSFKLKFDSSIDVKATQENNDEWEN
ncbi:carboxypeptidase-like regulatory domain-containing protein [Clostridium bornimense]|uniref:carboxypeptidase-like regulatory domain-containing protein n=1 Tax=Clostridium bornimense TaxID=1216932 RepID=UPI001C0FD360|nr:carboxypeptidase-like regulatory domain-containing protein [Clostridium bornimense]MBU5316101.1 carboxypeptidase-like regulatory domain-containing protein [Clostridium bornimense]